MKTMRGVSAPGVTVSAKLIKADGRVIDLGVICGGKQSPWRKAKERIAKWLQ